MGRCVETTVCVGEMMMREDEVLVWHLKEGVKFECR